MFESLAAHMGIFFVFVVIIGLVIGSFLNVVVYRLPIMLENQWRDECMTYLNTDYNITPKRFGLAFPASHCPVCSTRLAFWHNIPLVSYLLLRGSCNYCSSKIPFQYFLVELLCCGLTVLMAVQFGVTWPFFAVVLLLSFLLAISFIDLSHHLIPDVLTIPLIWLGLLVSCFELFTTTTDAIVGAVLGYVFFWIVGKVFYWVSRREGIGQGDYKLMAVAGAWLGWQLLPFVILTSSILALIVGSSYLLISRKAYRSTPIPFAPFIAIAILIGIVWGYDFTQSYLHLFGINSAMN